MGAFDLSCDVNNCRTEESENRSKEYRESRACRAIFEVLSYLFDITLTKIPIKHRLAFLKKVIGRGCDQSPENHKTIDNLNQQFFSPF